MTPALGEAAPQTGARYVCLDAGPLIWFNDTGNTEMLGEWLGPVAYTTAAVIELELKKRPGQNSPTIGAPWLYWVKSHPDDTRLVADLLRRFGKGPPENLGEAQVVAACKRYGWTAVIEDDEGRRAADDHGVAHVSTATLVGVAVAYDKLTPTQGWKLHAAMHSRGRISWLKPDRGNKPIFNAFCAVLRKLRLRQGDPDWPLLLATPNLDDLLIELVRRGPSAT